MRKTLLTGLLAVLATAAFGMGPAVAAAEIVTFVKPKTQEPLEVGSEIRGVTGNLQVHAAGISWSCAGIKDVEIEYMGELTENGTEDQESGTYNTTIDTIDSEDFLCSNGSILDMKFVGFKLTPMNFLPDGTIDYQIQFDEMKWKGNSCKNFGSIPLGGEWGSPYYWNGAAGFDFQSELKFTGPNCPTHVEMVGDFALTDEGVNEEELGLPVEIVVN